MKTSCMCPTYVENDVVLKKQVEKFEMIIDELLLSTNPLSECKE